MKTLKMLPYGWKKVGLALLALSLLIFVVCFKAIVHDIILINQSKWTDTFGSGWAYTLLFFSFTLGVVLTALSREKREDERIALMRHSALIWTALLLLLFSFINLLSNVMLSRYLDNGTFLQAMVIKRYFTCVPAYILYYLLIFNVSLWSDKKKLSDEE